LEPEKVKHLSPVVKTSPALFNAGIHYGEHPGSPVLGAGILYYGLSLDNVLYLIVK
jgi:hypothetical protein